MSTEVYPVALRGRGRLRVVPMTRTVVSEYESGMEQRDRRWLRRRFRFEITYPLIELTDDLAQTLRAFLDRHFGRYESFLFEDWTTLLDYGAYGRRFDEHLGVGNGSRTVFGLYENTLTSAVIYLDSVPQSQGATPEVVVDDATGLVTFMDPPAIGEVITADVEGGLFRVRLDTDEPDWQRVKSAGWAITVPMIQVRADA